MRSCPGFSFTLSLSLVTLLTAACGDAGGDSAGLPDTDGGSTAGSSSGGGGTSSGAPTTSAATTDPGGSESATMGATTGEPGGTTTTTVTTGPMTTDPLTTGPGTTGDTTGGDTTGGDVMPLDCLLEGFVNPDAAIQLDYAQFNPVIGSHCKGTNHQDIIDIERVVFLGDSVTVGTPPTLANDYYRAQLADALVDRFGLTPPNGLWDQSNPIDGVALIKDSGDFSSCAKWGARTDDFLPPGPQIDDCFPPDLMDKRTLVITTMGGNDIAAIAKDGANGKPYDEVMADAEAAVQKMRDAVHWFTDDPNKFPNGVFVVFANVYEFTDGTADLMSCPAAGLGGFDKPWAEPDKLIDMMLWFNEQYMDIAVETQTDMIFLLENFCGHGFKKDDPNAPCYRGPNQDTLFDLTCIHPTPKGHDVITNLFTSVVDE